MDKTNYERMKEILFNLAEWLNTPNDDLENMMGISWYAFHKLLAELKEEKEQ